MAVFYEISPGQTKYRDLISKLTEFPILAQDSECEVAIIGGGYTGLSAGYNLAKKNIATIVLEAGRCGDAASGRNGGQLGTGHRIWITELEKKYGQDKARSLLDLWFEAKDNVLELLCSSYNKGHITAIHNSRLIPQYRDYMEAMADYGYKNIQFLNKSEISKKLGSQRYVAGIYDSEAGHCNPLNLQSSLVRKATEAGAKIYEHSMVRCLEIHNGKFLLHTSGATIKAHRILLAINGYHLSSIDTRNLGGSLCDIKKRIFPIYSYIAATEPLTDFPEILASNESVDDSRFAVRYFRKESDNSLIFGGAETYFGAPISRIREKVGNAIWEVYPQLKNKIKITHGWGGIVAITRSRMPLVEEIYPNITYSGGYSGHGFCLASYAGKLYADAITGNIQAKEKLQLLKQLQPPVFWGGRYFSIPALFCALNYHALADRF